MTVQIHVVKFVEVQRVSNGYVVRLSTDAPVKHQFIASSAQGACLIIQDALEHGLLLAAEEEQKSSP